MKNLAIVVIGRNEGQRLIDCLDALPKEVCTVYVDSGSTDRSCDEARCRGVDVVELDMSIPFTAARARNAGAERARNLLQGNLEYIQFLDGDCVLNDGWMPTAFAFLEETPQAVVACGRNRERFPEKSVYIRVTDFEWETPIGQTLSCGGNAMIRASAFWEVGGFSEDLIAGEEPELCLQLRSKGGQIWCLDAEMALHDVGLLRFSQWWVRMKRSGFSAMSGVLRSENLKECIGLRYVVRAVFWGAALPLGIIFLSLFVTPWAVGLLMVYPIQVLRIWMGTNSFEWAFFITVSKFAEAQGALLCLWRRLTGSATAVIEHK